MPSLRRSLSNASSINSERSVKFDESNTVFYTHSSVDYDRSAPQETLEERMMQASINRFSVTDSPEEDVIVKKNTWTNSRRGVEGYNVLRQIRSR
jgi:hypothetical protein